MWLLNIDDIIRELTHTKSLLGVLLLLSALFFYKIYDILVKRQHTMQGANTTKKSGEDNKNSVQSEKISDKTAGTENLKKLIADGHTGVVIHEIIRLLKEKEDPINKKLYKEALLLSNRLRNKEYNENNKLWSWEEINIENNSINAALIHVIESI